jgi:hypothetical protein
MSVPASGTGPPGVRSGLGTIPAMPEEERPSLTWLLLLPFPNGGSTAIAKVLLTAPGVGALNQRAEGQWLVPDLSEPRARWDPAHQVDLARAKAIWLDTLRREHPGADVVVEKSPPNLCRYEQLIEALAPMPVEVVTFSRDPYATCASWHHRYGARRIERKWGLPEGTSVATEQGYFAALATIWVARAEMLRAARQAAFLHTSYEAFTAAPAEVVGAIAARVPAIAGADPHAAVQVKDRPAEPVRDMNAEQIATLAPPQIDALSGVFARHEDLLGSFGYAVR